MDTSQKIQDKSIHVRCKNCRKLLAKHVSPENLEIKCVRCGTIEVVSKKGA